VRKNALQEGKADSTRGKKTPDEGEGRFYELVISLETFVGFVWLRIRVYQWSTYRGWKVRVCFGEERGMGEHLRRRVEE